MIILVLLAVITVCYAKCASSDYLTIVGASKIYNVISITSSISPTTNDVAVGLIS